MWKAANAEPARDPEVAVGPFRQRMNDDCLRRVRVQLGKTVSIEPRHAIRCSHNQETVSRLQDVIHNIQREAVRGRERLTDVVGCGLPWVESHRGLCGRQQGNRAQTGASEPTASAVGVVETAAQFPSFRAVPRMNQGIA